VYGHYRIDHSKDAFVHVRMHINSVEGFWRLAKVCLKRFKGLPKHIIHLRLKETEWRYNHHRLNKYKTLLSFLRESPIRQA